MAFASAVLPFALGGIGVATSAASAIAEYQQGQFAKTIAGRQAQADAVQAKEIQQDAGQQIQIQDYKASHLLSRIVSSSAASGVTEEGSPTVQYQTSADEALLNDMYTQYAANIKSSSILYQGQLGEAEGGQEASAATLGALTEGFGGSISSGIEAYGLYKKNNSFSFSGNI